MAIRRRDVLLSPPIPAAFGAPQWPQGGPDNLFRRQRESDVFGFLPPRLLAIGSGDLIAIDVAPHQPGRPPAPRACSRGNARSWAEGPRHGRGNPAQKSAELRRFHRKTGKTAPVSPWYTGCIRANRRSMAGD